MESDAAVAVGCNRRVPACGELGGVPAAELMGVWWMGNR
jgi:hypothetical protein